MINGDKIMTRYASSGVIVLLVLMGLFTGCIDETSSSQILYVDAEGEQQFTHIQDAIDAAENNMTIFVYSGIYVENLKISNKSLILTGENPDTTIIDGNYSNDVLFVEADAQVTLSNFTLQHSGNTSTVANYDAIVSIHSSNNTIVHNIIKNGNVGIYIAHAPKNNISKNHIKHQQEYGVYVYSSSDEVILFDNEFRDNTCGARVKQSDHCTVFENLFQDNDKGFYFCCGSSSNTAYHNTFINNSVWNACDYVGGNKWYASLPVGGNYWDEYTGLDNFSGPGQDQPGSDGIGDKPFADSKADIDDLYPLMEPYL